MKLFKMLFGNSNTMETLRQALDRREWAQALAIGRDLQRTVSAPTEKAELDRLLVKAGDSLAELNLDEGDAFRRLGDESRAQEHFALALEQAHDSILRERATAAIQGHERPQEPVSVTAASCNSCSSPPPAIEQELELDDLDPQTRFELILASYPVSLAERYQQASGDLQEAFLFAHAGQLETAMQCLDKVPLAKRDDLFHFELGSLLGRLGAIDQACGAFEQAVKSNSLRLFALEALIDLLMAAGKNAEAEQRLLALLANGEAPAFCHARLTHLMFARQNDAQALEHGRQALALGFAGPDLLLLLATLLEKNGSLAEAEHLLTRLPAGGGCSGGGTSTHLAEFWMRHGMHLDRCLEGFKAAARSEPANPRWPLRMAQTYLQRGWKKEGMAMLEKVLMAPELNPELYQEGRALLDANR